MLKFSLIYLFTTMILSSSSLSSSSSCHVDSSKLPDSLSLSLSLSLSHTHTHTLSLYLTPSLSHTHTHTLTLSLYLTFLSLSLSLSLYISLRIRPYHPSVLKVSLNCIQCPQRANICKFFAGQPTLARPQNNCPLTNVAYEFFFTFTAALSRPFSSYLDSL